MKTESICMFTLTVPTVLLPGRAGFLRLEKRTAAFALTDHDTVEGVRKAQRAAEGTPLTVIPGVELSSDYKGRDIHVLGLGINPEDPRFLGYLADFRRARDVRNEKMLAKLREARRGDQRRKDGGGLSGLCLDPGPLCPLSPGSRLCPDMQEGFARYVGDDAPCFVPKEQISPFRAVKLLLENGAHPVLAHPLLYHLSSSQLEELVAGLKDCGLQGLEAVYSTNRLFR